MVMGAKSALFDRIAAVVSDTEGVAHDEVMRALTPVSDLLSWAIGGAAIVVLAHVCKCFLSRRAWSHRHHCISCTHMLSTSSGMSQRLVGRCLDSI